MGNLLEIAEIYLYEIPNGKIKKLKKMHLKLFFGFCI